MVLFSLVLRLVLETCLGQWPEPGQELENFIPNKQEWKNQLGLENKICQKFNFTSLLVLKLFFSGQIFLLLKFKIFKLKYFQKSWLYNFNSSDIAIRMVVFKEPHWQNCRDFFFWCKLLKHGVNRTMDQDQDPSLTIFQEMAKYLLYFQQVIRCKYYQYGKYTT